LAWLGALGVDYRLVATKADKLPHGRRDQARRRIEAELGSPVLAFSSLTDIGRAGLFEIVYQARAAARADETR
jgi:GTP-binding protein EngB required for normal cell division